MGGLTPEEKRELLKLAREALEMGVRGQRITPVDLDSLPPTLREPGASFVTLTKNGQLRGCIGTLEARLPLAEDVREHAVAAGLDDYRFPPVSPRELDEIEIEISRLTPPQPLEYTSPEELLQALRPGIDGV
ncbi:MAG: AmmeMemoRadiSam system protein A, partial [Bellilinea sp.]